MDPSALSSEERSIVLALQNAPNFQLPSAELRKHASFLPEHEEMLYGLLETKGLIWFNSISIGLRNPDGRQMGLALQSLAALSQVSPPPQLSATERQAGNEAMGPTTINIHGGTFHGTTIQAGNANIATLTQQSGDIAAAMLAVLQECRDLIDTVEAPQRDQAKVMLDTIQAEVKSSTPNTSRVQAAFQLLDTCTKAGTSLAALVYKLKPMWDHLLGHRH